MLYSWRFSHPVFNNIYTANILGMWEKRRGFTPHAEVLPPIEPVSHWTIPEKLGGGGVEDKLF